MEKETILDVELINKLFISVEDKCKEAIIKKEVPVACLFYNTKNKKIIASSHNLTNKTNNATTHAEINCINYITNELKLNPIIFEDTIVVVSCEPCIMCGYALALINIKAVYFGCYNEKFGGNGSVLNLNKMSTGIKGYPSYGGYFTEKFINILKNFYENGNEKLDETKRHRKLKEEAINQK